MFGAFSEFPGSWQKEDAYNKPVCLRNCCRCFFLLFFFFFSLIYFSLNQKVTGMHLVCAKFCAGRSDTKMGRTKSWPQDAQNVVGGADEETSQWLGVGCEAVMRRRKYRGKDDSDSALGDPGRLPSGHQRHVSKREVQGAERQGEEASRDESVGKGAKEMPGTWGL